MGVEEFGHEIKSSPKYLKLLSSFIKCYFVSKPAQHYFFHGTQEKFKECAGCFFSAFTMGTRAFKLQKGPYGEKAS